MNYLNSLSKTVRSYASKNDRNKNQRQHQHNNANMDVVDEDNKNPDYETEPDCTSSITDCIGWSSSSTSSYATSTNTTHSSASSTQLLHDMSSSQPTTPTTTTADGGPPSQQHPSKLSTTSPHALEHFEERAHRTHHPHHNSVTGLSHQSSAAMPISYPCPSNSIRAVPRGFLLSLQWEDVDGHNFERGTDDEEFLSSFLADLSSDEKELFAMIKRRMDEIDESAKSKRGGSQYANWVRPTLLEVREMAVVGWKFEMDYIVSRYLNLCNFIVNEPAFGAVPYWQVLDELRKGYYTLAGDDVHGCAIVVLEQSRIDGDVDFMIRAKTAMTVARAVVSLDVSYARHGVSMFADLTNISWGNISLKYQRFIYTTMHQIFWYAPGFMCLYQVPTLVRWAFKLSKPFLTEHYRDLGNKVLDKNDKMEGRFDWFANRDQIPVKYGGTFVPTPERDLVRIVHNYLLTCGVSEDELVQPF